MEPISFKLGTKIHSRNIVLHAGLPEAPKQDCGSLRGGGFCLPQQVPVYPPLLEMWRRWVLSVFILVTVRCQSLDRFYLDPRLILLWVKPAGIWISLSKCNSYVIQFDLQFLLFFTKNLHICAKGSRTAAEWREIKFRYRAKLSRSNKCEGCTSVHWI